MTRIATRQRGSVLAVAAIGMAALMMLMTAGTASAAITLTSVTPNQGPLAGGTVVTIVGTGFSTNAANIDVTFGGVAADSGSISVNAAGTIITATVPEGTVVATVGVTVGISDESTTLANGFTYLNNPPQIIGIAPEQAPAGSTVRVFGINIDNGASVKFGATLATAGTWVSENEIDVTVPAGTGTVDVTVTNEDDQAAILTDGFTYGAGSGGPLGSIITGRIPAAGGYGLIVFGGANAQLLSASGCPMATATFFATNASGGFVTYIPGSGVAAVNAAWNSLFPTGIPALTALIGRCV